MIKFRIAVVALAALAAVSGAGAATSLVTSSAGLGSVDNVNWSQLGADGDIVGPTFSATSVGGQSVSGSLLAGTNACVAVVGGNNCAWSVANGFAAESFPIQV